MLNQVLANTFLELKTNELKIKFEKKKNVLTWDKETIF